MDETYRKVEEHLARVSLARHLGIAITPETEIYRDLKMYGDDLAFDLVLWAHREFGVQGNFRLSDYAPGETPFKMWDSLRRLIGKKERRYKSLTVRDVVAAIETKHWPE
jgi:Protein of unknown function (DUF1493)